MKAKIELQIVFEKCVCMRVLKMDESLRGKLVIFEHDGIIISSFYTPGLNIDTVYLFGKDKSADKRIGSLDFNTKDEAEAYVRNVKNAFVAWAREDSKEKTVGTRVILEA